MSTFERLAAAALIAAAIAFVGYSIGELRRSQQFVEVRGLAERDVKSDRANWQIGIAATGGDALTVHRQLSDRLEKTRAFLLARGFAAAEVQKGQLNVNENTSESGTRGRYTARATIALNTTKVDAVEKAAAETEALLEQGVIVENSNTRYYFTDLNAIKPAMLDEATKSARSAAEAFAKNANARLGSIRTATQGLFTIGAPLSEYEGEGSVQKKVRVVTKVQFYLVD
jgi:uncharacterized protein